MRLPASYICRLNNGGPLLVSNDDVLTRLTSSLADRYRIDRELGAGGMATVFLATRPAARPRRRHQGAAPRPRRRARRRAVSERDQDDRAAPASAHPPAARLGQHGRTAVLRDAARHRRDVARAARAREATARGRRDSHRERGRRRTRLRARSGRDSPRHQAREHPAPGRPRHASPTSGSRSPCSRRAGIA